jgi:hypothetical protein
MGKMTEEILELLKKQVVARGIVVWYDPEKAFTRLVPLLGAQGITVLSYEEGFFNFRERLEHLLEFVDDLGRTKPDADIPPDIVIYIPLAREETNYAFIEAETAGVVMEPGTSRPECNTKLCLAVERVFSKIAPARAKHLARQAEEGLLTIEELDRIADEAGQAASGLLQVVFGPLSVDEILLQFVASDAKDRVIAEKNTLPELAALLHEELGLSGLDNKQIREVRTALRRYLLSNELLAEIPEEKIPETLRRVPRAEKPASLDLVRQICRVWRNRIDLKAFYCDAAEAVEKEIRLSDTAIPLAELLRNETFLRIDRIWLGHAARKLAEGGTRETLEIIGARISLFWAKERPGLQIEWKVLEAAAQICRKADEITCDLRKQQWALDDLVQAYAQHVAPWMSLDRFFRLMESRYAGLEIMESGGTGLEKVVVLARRRYSEALQEMTSAYSIAASKAEFRSERFGSQSHIYKDVVRQLIDKKEKTAYFLVDALRYEMASDILEGIDDDYEGRIEPRLGQLPGITAIGMVALLPGAEKGLFAEKKGSGISVAVGEHPLLSRQARLDWLRDNSGLSVAFFRLGETLKLTPKRKKEIESANLIVVTSQEIDRMGEEAGEEEDARVYIDGIPDKVRRAIRSLARAGVKWFVIAADHGFHLVDSLDPGMSMDGPGGDIVELHPRVWIGQGGAAAEGYFRVKASDLGLGGSLEFAFPRGLGVFKVKGGSGSYFHGGLSPQEHVLPVLIISAKDVLPAAKSVLGVKVSMAKAKVTNRIFTVTVEAQAGGIFPEEGRRVRLELLADKEEIGKAVAAGYDYDERKNEIVVQSGRPNVVTLILHRGAVPSCLTIQVVDVESQIVLDTIKDIPVELTI